MSTFWRVAGQSWESLRLDDVLARGGGLGLSGVMLFRFGQGVDAGVALATRTGVRVRLNGETLPGGLRVLQHKDEILLGNSRLVYSAETRPAIVTFRVEPGSRLPTCPICRGAVRGGDQAVRCPGMNCARWFHEIAGSEKDGVKPKRCWSYNAKCSLCGHPTTLDGGDVWRPELEEACA